MSIQRRLRGIDVIWVVLRSSCHKTVRSFMIKHRKEELGTPLVASTGMEGSTGRSKHGDIPDANGTTMKSESIGCACYDLAVFDGRGCANTVQGHTLLAMPHTHVTKPTRVVDWIVAAIGLCVQGLSSPTNTRWLRALSHRSVAHD